MAAGGRSGTPGGNHTGTLHAALTSRGAAQGCEWAA